MPLNISLKKYKTILENIIALFSIRGLEYLLALVTLPYLVRVLGPEKYGAIAFAQSFVQYFSLITDYGFNLTGPKNIASAKNEHERGQLFIAIICAKFILAVFCTGIFFLLISSLSIFKKDFYLYIGAYLAVIGNIVFPVWFFQGIQKMKYITFANISARMITVIGIFMLVKTSEDYIITVILQSITSVIAGIFSFYILFFMHRYVFITPTWQMIWHVFVEGWQIFISTIAINIYTVSNTFFLGLLTDNVIVGYFTSANKIIESIKGLMGPISQSIYPYISSMVKNSRTEAILFLRKCMLVLCGGNLLLSIGLFVFADEIVFFLLGQSYASSIYMIRIMAFLPFIISLSNIFGIQTMIPFGWQNLFSKIVILSAILNTCLVFPLIYFFSGEGVALTMVITECFVTFATWYLLKKQGINYVKWHC